MKNALVLGAAGQLGSELVRLLGPAAGVGHEQVSVTDARAVDALMAERRPEVVFNCAAYNAVDRAEGEPETAFAVNAEAPRIVALACSRHDARLIHFSTNFVFDGSLDRGYVESDEPAPLGVYGRSKLEGERQALDALPEALVVRTAAVFGGSGSFPARIVGQARLGAAIRVVSDQRINPTYASDLAARAVELARSEMRGLVHVVGGGCCSWHELAAAVLEAAGVSASVEAVASGAYPAPARRPLNGCLASERVTPLRPWREAVGDWARAVTKPSGA